MFYFVRKRLEFLCESYTICHMTGLFLVIHVHKQIAASRQNYEKRLGLAVLRYSWESVMGIDSTVEDTPR
jgi:hypothetical protein